MAEERWPVFGVLGLSRVASYALVLPYLAVGAILLIAFPGHFLMDDAYITLHNAQALLRGSDPTYAVSPLTGATSAAHLALVAALGLAVSLPLASAIVSCAAAVGYLAGLRALAVSAGCRGWAIAVVMIVGTCIGYVPLYYFNGLETVLAMAVVAWALALRDSRWLAILCGVMPFVRPELAFLAAPLFLRHIVMSDSRIRTIGLAAVPAALFALWYLAETGVPYPNTGGAKVAFFAEAHLSIVQRTSIALAAVAGAGFLPLGIGLLRIRSVPAGWSIAVFALCWLAMAVMVLPSALMHNHFRYLGPLIPALLYPLAALLAERRSIALPAVLIGWTAMTLGLSLPQFGPGLRFVAEGMQAAQFVRDRVPAGATVLVHDAGIVAWMEPKVRIVDVVGLKTPPSALAHQRHTTRTGDWGKALNQIACDSGATHLVALKGDGFWENVATSLEGEGWVLEAERLPSGIGYAVYRISRPGTCS